MKNLLVLDGWYRRCLFSLNLATQLVQSVSDNCWYPNVERVLVAPLGCMFLACWWVLALLLSDTDGWVCGVCLQPGRPTPKHNLMNGTSSRQSWALFCSLPAVWTPRRGSSQLRDEVFTCQQSLFFCSLFAWQLLLCFVFPSPRLFPWLSLGKKKGKVSVLFFREMEKGNNYQISISNSSLSSFYQ